MTVPPIKVKLTTISEWVDFWRYDIGMNVIPVVSKAKVPKKGCYWSEYQDKPISQEQHEKWKAEGAFNEGVAIILGKVWHNKDKEGYHLNCIDADNQLAVRELLTRKGKTKTVDEWSLTTLVEQHEDDHNRLHFYVYTIGQPLRDKSSDAGKPGMDHDSIPAFEVKASSNKLSYVCPSIHKNGYPVEVLGIYKPVVLGDVETAEFQEHLDNICRKYSLKYNGHGDSTTKIPITDLFKEDTIIYGGHNRHEALLRAMESLLKRNIGILSLEEIAELASKWNQKHCRPPLDDREFNRQWNDANNFISKNGNRHQELSSSSEDDSRKQSTQKDWSYQELLRRYEHLRNVTIENIPHLWPALEYALSIKTILNIKDCTLPFIGIIIGPASSNKTVAIESFRETDHAFYTDNFSAKSLVSHISGMTEEQLRKIDLLPRLKNKFFLTPELGPMFSLKEDDLRQVLGILTRIADGHGYTSDSGAQGHRGYNEDIMFTWIGACVDISPKVHKMLGSLGPKLYFFRLSRQEEAEDDYHNSRDIDFNAKTKAIRKALSEYLEYFELNPNIVREEGNPLSKIQMDTHMDEELADRIIIRVGILLAHLRAIVPTWETKDMQGSDYAYTFANIEDPSRAITQLRNLARGHALSKGRTHFTMDDIPIVIHTALSTASTSRVRIFELLIANKGNLTSHQIVDYLNTTRPTALKTMTELKATELVDMIDHDPEQYNSTKEIKLKSKFKWFLTKEFVELKEKGLLEIPSETCKEKSPPERGQVLYEYDDSSIETLQNKPLFGGENSLQLHTEHMNKNAEQTPTDSYDSVLTSRGMKFYGGNWHCDCVEKGDRWSMEKHTCNWRANK